MKSKHHFTRTIVTAIDASRILGIRAGVGDHRFIGIWAVVVEGRVFVRSYTLKKNGWFRAFLENPRGAISIGGREIPIRAVQTRSERLKDAVERAYAEKYHTPGSLKYVRGFHTKRRRDATMELMPLRSTRRR